jgi:hypothetical protein
MKTLKSILRNDTIKSEALMAAVWVGIIAAVAIPLSPMF